MSEKLKPCPCGKTPTKLVLEEGATCKYAYCGGNCCGSWLVEFPTGYAHVSSYAAMEMAIPAWNGARRKDEQTIMKTKTTKNIGSPAWNCSAFLDLPIVFSDYARQGEWTKTIERHGTVAELLDIWDIDDPLEMSETAQVLRLLRCKCSEPNVRDIPPTVDEREIARLREEITEVTERAVSAAAFGGSSPALKMLQKVRDEIADILSNANVDMPDTAAQGSDSN